LEEVCDVEKIAIQCPTEELFKRVRKRIGKGSRTWKAVIKDPTHKAGSGVCLELDGDHGREGWFRSMGYKIISAAEYLNEGGKDVSELQVEIASCSGAWWYAKHIGDIFVIDADYTDNTDYKVKGKGLYIDKRDCFLIETKTQTTKENNMNINKTIRKIFAGAPFEQVEKMQEHFGSEIQENFSGEIFLKANKKKFEDEIIRIEEAKRLEKEEKEG
jgi:hypothetical protein